MNEKRGIIVVGSTNVDLVARVAHLPLPGETVGNADYTTAYGGKGANQAIAAARAGGDVVFVTNLGDDSYGSELIPYFRDNAINSEYLFVEKNTPTGVAIILVADSGENCIAVAPGANRMLVNGKIERIHAAIEQAEYLLLQMEIPYASVASLIDYAYRTGTQVVLNPAPAMPLEPDLLRKISLLILNETEAEIISGLRLADHDPAILAERIRDMGPETIILTLGASGAYICSPGDTAVDPGVPGEDRRYDCGRGYLLRGSGGPAHPNTRSPGCRAICHGRCGVDRNQTRSTAFDPRSSGGREVP